MWRISYWFFPLFSSIVWLAMLIALIVTWVRDGKPHYPSMSQSQTIPFISDIGAQRLKPLFIAMGATTVVCFDMVFIIERWLRHLGILAKNTSFLQKLWSWISIVTAIAGAAGLILLAVFDTLRHPKMHNGFLALFIGGYVLSAIFICIEYQRLGYHFKEHRIIAYSFWIKLAFIIVEIALAIAFGVCQKQSHYNTAAVIEWVIALIYTFYVLSFFIDFIPARRTKHHQSRETEEEVAMAQAVSDSDHPGGRYYTSVSPAQNSYVNSNGHLGNGHAV